jgi:hypothetical protein
MAKATDLQVQQAVDQRLRVRAEQIRALVAALDDDYMALPDVTEATTAVANPLYTPTWIDGRQDGPPHLMTAAEVAGYRAFCLRISNLLKADAAYPTVAKACVRPVELT